MTTLIPSHSIILLIGPTGCGKSTFAKHLEQEGANVISSDMWRSYFSGYEPDSNDPGHMEVSEPAFKMFMTELDAITSFPISAPQVVVDTTGLSEHFRLSVAEIAKKNHYNLVGVIFDFNKKADYYKFSTHREKALVERHVETLKRRVLPIIKSKDYHLLIRHHTVGVLPDVTLDIKEDMVLDNAFIIGDIHECVPEFEALYAQAPEGSTVILLGDYLDKGGQTKEMIESIEAKLGDRFLIICANHENYVAKRIRGLIEPNLELEADYFTSLNVLLEDNDLAQRFLAIWDQSIPFVRLKAYGQSTVYVTHAPVETKYLGKWDKISQTKQRNYILDRGDNVFKFPLRPFNTPLQVCGHISHSPQDKLLHGGIYYLDTGCVDGYALTALHYSEAGFATVQVPSTRERTKELYTFVPDRPPKKLVVEDPRDQRFLRKLPSTGVRFISATMAPSRSTNTDIESLEEGIKAFKGELVELQPKYMGSRAQVYLGTDPDKDFCVSRNGFVVRDFPGLKEAFAALRVQMNRKDVVWKNNIILDCELLPWSALGKDLITKEFIRYQDGILLEISLLKEMGVDVSEREAHLVAFKAQLDRYGQESPPEFKPFGILELDGVLMAHEATFDKVSFDLSMRTKTFGAHVQSFFDHHVESNGMEGIVIKPVHWKEGLPPFIKVRNKEYLRLVYGYDYLDQNKYEALCRNKRVGSKASLSEQEHILGIGMLTSKTEDELVRNAFEMLATIKKEQTLDPRL